MEAAPHPEIGLHGVKNISAQVANLSDEIAYYSHDLDDGLDAGLLTEPKLRRDVTIWSRAARQVRREHGRLPDECRRYFIIRQPGGCVSRNRGEFSARLTRTSYAVGDGRSHP